MNRKKKLQILSPESTHKHSDVYVTYSKAGIEPYTLYLWILTYFYSIAPNQPTLSRSMTRVCAMRDCTVWSGSAQCTTVQAGLGLHNARLYTQAKLGLLNARLYRLIRVCAMHDYTG